MGRSTRVRPEPALIRARRLGYQLVKMAHPGWKLMRLAGAGGDRYFLEHAELCEWMKAREAERGEQRQIANLRARILASGLPTRASGGNPGT